MDAVIRLGTNLVPVDAKFPLENFKRMIETAAEDEQKSAKRKFLSDVKKHVDSISCKYILPDEGTFDFALMYIPAENVYYELIIKDEAVDTDKATDELLLYETGHPCLAEQFLCLSSNHPAGAEGPAYRGAGAGYPEKAFPALRRLRPFQSDFDVIGKHLTSTKSKFDEADKRLLKFGDRLQSLSGAEAALIEDTSKLPL